MNRDFSKRQNRFIKRDRSYDFNYKNKFNYVKEKINNPNDKFFNQNIKLFFEEKYIINLKKDYYLERIQEKLKIKKLYIEKVMRIPKNDGKFIVIFDYDNDIKFKCISKIIKDYKRYHNHQNVLNKYKEIKIKMTIPESIISQFIGSNGRNINNIKEKCKVVIRVEDSIPGLRDRIVLIVGHYKDIIKAIEKITKKVETLLIDESKGYNKVEEKEEIDDFDENLSIENKFIFEKNQIEILKYTIEKLSNKYDIHYEIKNLTNKEIDELKYVKEDNLILKTKGIFKNLKEFLSELINEIEIEFQEKGKQFDLFKIITSNNLVTKLIGVKGSMIREIASKSSGAQIKILSDRESEKNLKECIITVAGSLLNKQIAVNIIIKKIETFKLELEKIKIQNNKLIYIDKNKNEKVNCKILIPDNLINYLNDLIFKKIQYNFNCNFKIEENNLINNDNEGKNNGKLLKINCQIENISKIIEFLYFEINKFVKKNNYHN